jgi:hypothetical protein
MPPLLPVALLGSLLALGTGSLLSATEVPPAPSPSLVPNGDFTTWPGGWRPEPGITWNSHPGTPFLQLSTDPSGKPVTLFRSLSVPPGVQALQATIRYQAPSLKTGSKKDAAAGLFFSLTDAVKIPVLPTPHPLLIPQKTSSWTQAETRFKVPAGTSSIEIRFGLLGGETGSLDLQSLSLTPIPETEVPTATADPATSDSQRSADLPIRREGDRTIIGSGQPTVWFIHPYVDVLGHNFSDGLMTLVRQMTAQGHPLAVGVSPTLEPALLQDEPHTTYVFSYKNINYPLPEQAQRLIFINTWLLPSVTWPALRQGKKDVVLIGSRMFNNDGDGLATNKSRWYQIQKDDPSLRLTVLNSTGFYLPLAVWRIPLTKLLLEDYSKSTASRPQTNSMSVSAS